MRMRIGRVWAGFARGAAALGLAALAAAALLAACSDPLPDAGDAPATESLPANYGEERLNSDCRPQESGAENLQRSRLLRLILLVGQIEVALRSSALSLHWEDVPIFPLSAEHRALLRTNAAEVDAIRRGIEAVLDEMEGSDRAQELRSRRQPLMLASIAWADWLIELVERGEEAFDEQPDGGAPIRQARELFDELLAELYSLDARSACPDSSESAAAGGDGTRANAVILRMLMLISLMESEVRSVCAVTGCPVRRVDAPLTAAERAVLGHAGSRLVILRDLVWDPQDLRLTETSLLPRALLADLEAAPVPLDELTTQWFRFASRGARGGPDALSGAQVIYGILGAQVAVFNVYARHFGLP